MLHDLARERARRDQSAVCNLAGVHWLHQVAQSRRFLGLVCEPVHCAPASGMNAIAANPEVADRRRTIPEVERVEEVSEYDVKRLEKRCMMRSCCRRDLWNVWTDLRLVRHVRFLGHIVLALTLGVLNEVNTLLFIAFPDQESEPYIVNLHVRPRHEYGSYNDVPSRFWVPVIVRSSSSESELLHNPPDARRHSSADLGELRGGLVDVEVCLLLET